MKISFCISCMNRLYQIQQTLRKNINDNKDFDDIEFIIVDFGSIDGLKEYIYIHFEEELKSGLLKYYFTDELKYWHACIAKNTTHMLATGDYLVNLDADNFVGFKGAEKLYDVLMNHTKDVIIHQTDTILGSGNSGRITMSRENFINLGGYDETFYPSGYNDPDLIKRGIKFGLKYLNWENPNYNQAIKNSKEENVKNCNISISWDQMNKLNELKSEFNIEHNEVIANKYRPFIGIQILK